MSAVLVSPSVRCLSAADYLFLGDLLLVLEESPGPTTSRWLMTVLDRVLSLGHDAEGAAVSEWELPAGIPEFPPDLIEKLQRLRDRVALRAPYQLLVNEVRCELHALFRQLQRR